jgi:hypothetical protein
MAHNTVRNACGNQKGKKKEQNNKETPEIPQHVARFFKQHKNLNFPDTGTVIITPLGDGRTSISIGGGDPKIKAWNIKEGVTLTFKDGVCVSVS